MPRRGAEGELQDRSVSPVHEDMRLQRAIWVAERVAWGAMALLVLLAMLGAFSMGMLSSTISGSPDGSARIEHDAVLRDGRSYDFIVSRSGLQPAAEVAVAIDGLDFNALELEGITPPPLSHQAGENATLFHFASAGDGTLKVNFSIRPQHPGSGELAVSVAGGPPARAGFLVLP